jgi:hypothetical protein
MDRILKIRHPKTKFKSNKNLEAKYNFFPKKKIYRSIFVLLKKFIVIFVFPSMINTAKIFKAS